MLSTNSLKRMAILVASTMLAALFAGTMSTSARVQMITDDENLSICRSWFYIDTGSETDDFRLQIGPIDLTTGNFRASFYSYPSGTRQTVSGKITIMRGV